MPKTPHTTPLVSDPATILRAAVPLFAAEAGRWPGATFPAWRCLHRAVLDATRAAAPDAGPIEVHAVVDACAYALMGYLLAADVAPRGWARSVEPTWQHLGHALHVWRTPERYMRRQVITDIRHLITNAAAFYARTRKEGHA